jgi:hypothetical protein
MKPHRLPSAKGHNDIKDDIFSSGRMQAGVGATSGPCDWIRRGWESTTWQRAHASFNAITDSIVRKRQLAQVSASQ